jgi:hypothetical protein
VQFTRVCRAINEGTVCQPRKLLTVISEPSPILCSPQKNQFINVDLNSILFSFAYLTIYDFNSENYIITPFLGIYSLCWLVF